MVLFREVVMVMMMRATAEGECPASMLVLEAIRGGGGGGGGGEV